MTHTAKALGAMLRSDRFRAVAVDAIRAAIVTRRNLPDAARDLECSVRALQVWLAEVDELAACRDLVPARGRKPGDS